MSRKNTRVNKDSSVAPRYLLVFTRLPQPGTTKTRMIPALGEQGAADLQRDMTLHTLSTVSQLLLSCDVAVEVHHAGGTAAQLKCTFGVDWDYVAQIEGDLGARMRHATEKAFRCGAKSVVVIGTDCPGLSVNVLRKAFGALEHADLVFNPATDGGYVLLGMRRPVSDIFDKIAWGSDTVLRVSLARAKRADRTTHLLDPLDDVDGVDDLSVWRRADLERRKDAAVPRISVIVPAINESDGITETLALAATGCGVELIVVDGGSTDDTVEKAKASGATVIHAPRGRAVQMNAGARVATGDILLFLHADTLVPPAYDRAIRDVLVDAGTVGGAFRLAIDSTRASFRFIERAACWRSRLFNISYGDQALFIRRSVFEKIGGYPSQPIMEDYALVRRARGFGQLLMLDLAVRTSPRRWSSNGIWRTTLRNQVYFVAYKLGVSPDRVDSWRKMQKAPSCE